MTISKKTLVAIQKAGAAVFAADAELTKAVALYADQVRAAMGENPFALGNDTLFQNWKVVARLAKTVAGMEEELKSVHLLASELVSSAQPLVHEVLTLAPPKPTVKKATKAKVEVVATDVKVKKTKHKVKPKARTLKAKSGASSVITSDLDKSKPLTGNPAKLMVHFHAILNPTDFFEINQTQAAQATGIPLGSMTAAIKKLVELGHVVAGNPGHYRLPEGSYHLPAVG